MLNHELKVRIMRRVYVIYYMRKALSPRALKIYAFTAACLGTLSVVSVSNVLANMPGDLAGIGAFLVAAFANTQVTVQALSVAAFLALAILIVDIIRSFSGMPQVRRV